MIDYEKALVLLADSQVRFVIVGGLAVTLHGLDYVTFDFDLCYAHNAENFSRLTPTLRPLRFAPGA